jgi:hypothetical protein
MTTFSLFGRLNGLLGRPLPRRSPALPLRQPCLSELAKLPVARLPLFVRESEVAMKYLRLLGALDWTRFPDRPDRRFHPDCPSLSYAPVVGAHLVKIDQRLAYMSDLWDYLVEHPPLVWVLGFPLVHSSAFSWGFDVRASLPTHRHLSRLLRTLSNASPKFLLTNTVHEIQSTLARVVPNFGDCISLDTKVG